MTAPTHTTREERAREERVLVTGLGIYCSVADDVRAFHAALLASQKGFRRITEFDVSACRNDLAAKLDVVEEQPTRSGMRGNMLLTRAVHEALADASLGDDVDGRGVGVTMGTSLGGMAGYVDWMQRADVDDDGMSTPLNPHNRLRGHELVLNIPPSLLACEIAREHGYTAGTASCVTA
ncbi:MAG: hypothetical protein JO180_05885, partial [Gemmatirosa sp.]|nr:hypothetical protein [Gemmatirosa sp.]